MTEKEYCHMVINALLEEELISEGEAESFFIELSEMKEEGSKNHFQKIWNNKGRK